MNIAEERNMTMIRNIGTIPEHDARSLARQRFIEISRFDQKDPKHCLLMNKGDSLREKLLAVINIRYTECFCEPSSFHEGVITIGDWKITCNFFHRIPESCIEGIYLFILTAGEIQCESENMLDSLFADTWGTSYVDAGVRLLKDRLTADMELRFPGPGVKLTREFGPGYYGMPVSETSAFFHVLHGEELGMSLTDSGLLIPQKSCSGMLFAVNDLEFDEGPECIDCRGGSLGCQYCQIMQKKSSI